MLLSAACVVLLAHAPAPTPSRAAPEPASRPADQRPRFHVDRAPAPVTVDGVLDESAWARPADLELTYETFPGENTPSPVRTEVWMTYDQQRLYFAFRAADPEPAGIVARYTDRDLPLSDDYVSVALDTFADERRAYRFQSNPLGVQMDFLYNEITNTDDVSWDALWDSAGRLTATGYQVEMAVPFSSLRFPLGEKALAWGVRFERLRPRAHFTRLNEAPVARERNCRVCQFSRLVGLAAIQPSRDLELDPTITATGHEAGRRQAESELGLSGRWGITPNMTLTGALNPDFSQVEADAAQLDVNTRFALFFPEKRPFFQEGADLFQTRLGVVYTRTLADPEWGIKLTGKTGAHALGALLLRDAVTNLLIPGAEGSELGSLPDESSAAILRYRRDLGPKLTAGLLYTDRRSGDYQNQLAGFDSFARFGASGAVRVEYMRSESSYPDALAEAFGQPRGTFEDHAYRLAVARQTRNWTTFAVWKDLGDGFRADLGFVPQVGIREGELHAEHFWHGNAESWFSRIAAGGNYADTRRQDGSHLSRHGQAWWFFEGARQSFVSIWGHNDRRVYLGVPLDESWVEVGLELRAARWLVAGLTSSYGDRIDVAHARIGRNLRLDPGLRFELGRHLTLRLEHSSEEFRVQPGALFDADLTQLRASYQFNLRMFLRWIAQYTEVERNPRAHDFPVAPRSRDLLNQLLLSYKWSPQTVVFLGYSDSHAGADRLERTSRTVFLKVGYAWQQ